MDGENEADAHVGCGWDVPQKQALAKQGKQQAAAVKPPVMIGRSTGKVRTGSDGDDEDQPPPRRWELTEHAVGQRIKKLDKRLLAAILAYLGAIY